MSKEKLKRRSFISMTSLIFASVFVKKAKASSLSNGVEVSGKKEILLPNNPRPFSSLVEIKTSRIERLFSKKTINPGNEKINSVKGIVKLRDVFENTPNDKVFLQYTGPDMGWIVIS
jgi:hypothetical protein